MDPSKSKPSPQKVFNNQKEFSNKIQGIQEISTHTNNIKITNYDDKRVVFNAVNFYYHDLCAVIFQLRQVVIRIIGDEQSVHDLQEVIAELSKIVLAIQELLNLEIEEIKIQLTGILTDINSQVENLRKIIEYDNLHEYKQKVLDNQLDLVIYTDTLKFYVQFCGLSLTEVERMSHERIEKIKNNLHQIKSGHEVHTEEFVHYMRHSVHHIQKLLDYLRKLINTEHFQNDVRDILKITENVGADFMRYVLEALRSENPIEDMLDNIDLCDKALAECCIQCEPIFQQSDNEVVKDLIIYLYIFGLTGLTAMSHSLEDGIMKK